MEFLQIVLFGLGIACFWALLYSVFNWIKNSVVQTVPNSEIWILSYKLGPWQRMVVNSGRYFRNWRAINIQYKLDKVVTISRYVEIRNDSKNLVLTVTIKADLVIIDPYPIDEVNNPDEIYEGFGRLLEKIAKARFKGIALSELEGMSPVVSINDTNSLREMALSSGYTLKGAYYEDVDISYQFSE